MSYLSLSLRCRAATIQTRTALGAHTNIRQHTGAAHTHAHPAQDTHNHNSKRTPNTTHTTHALKHAHTSKYAADPIRETHVSPHPTGPSPCPSFMRCPLPPLHSATPDSIWGRLDLIMSLTQTESHQASVAGLPFHPIRFAMESSPGGGRVAAAGVTGAWSSAALPGRNKRRASEATKAGLAVSSITALTAVFSLFVPLCIISDWIRFN